MPGGNALSLRVREWVEHAVVRVDGGEPVLLQLLLHHLYDLQHPGVVVGPVTDDLGGCVRGESNNTK